MKSDRISPSQIQHLPQSLTGPRVNMDFWNNHVSPAGVGPIERGCQAQIKALRSLPKMGRVR